MVDLFLLRFRISERRERKLNMKRKWKILLSSASLIAVGGGIGVYAITSTPVSTSTSVNTNENNNNYVNYKTKGSVVTGNKLTFSAVVQPNSQINNYAFIKDGALAVGTYNKEINMGSDSITPTYTSGYIQTYLGNGDTVPRYSSSEYHNNRTYMPILDTTEHYYHSERTSGEIQRGAYRGWEISGKGYVVFGEKYSYTASPVLKTVFNNLQTETINAIQFNLDLSNTTIESINTYLQENKDIQFVTVRGINQNTDLSKLVLPENIKKLSLFGERNTINDLKLPTDLQEIEIYLGKSLKSVDPLIFPRTTNIISDVAANNTSSVFTEIKLSDSTIDNTSAKLQQAINDVYTYRIKERAFQGLVTGGYIGSWDLTGTKVTSFNHVTIPLLNDGTGRFYIAHVEVKTDGNIDSTQNETITNKPSNDSQINDWFDWGGGWQKVQEVVVSSSENVSLETATQEIMGFIAKYPNIKKINIVNIKLVDNVTHEQLKENVLKAIEAKYGEESQYKEIEFILPEVIQAPTA